VPSCRIFSNELRCSLVCISNGRITKSRDKMGLERKVIHSEILHYPQRLFFLISHLDAHVSSVTLLLVLTPTFPSFYMPTHELQHLIYKLWFILAQLQPVTLMVIELEILEFLQFFRKQLLKYQKVSMLM
jgi:hypothetical protein